MAGPSRRHVEHQWRIGASLFALLALILSIAADRILRPPSPWGFVMFLGISATVIVGGTRWLVARSRDVDETRHR